MLVLESIIQRHPTVDSKKNRLTINLAMTGIDILAVRLVFGTAAVGAAQFAEERGWGLFNFIEWWGGLEVVVTIVIMDLLGVLMQHRVKIIVEPKFKVKMDYISVIVIQHVRDLEIVVMISLNTADTIAMVKI